MIVDFIADERACAKLGDSEARKTIRVNGFEEEGMRKMVVEGAGLEGFAFETVEGRVAVGEAGAERLLFFARGRRAVDGENIS